MGKFVSNVRKVKKIQETKDNLQKYQNVLKEYDKNLKIIKKYAPNDFPFAREMVLEFDKELPIYQKILRIYTSTPFILSEDQMIIDKFLALEKKINAYLKLKINLINEKYPIFIKFDEIYNNIREIFAKSEEDYLNSPRKLLIDELKTILIQILKQEQTNENYAFICEALINYNFLRLNFDKLEQVIAHKYLNNFNLSNYTLPKEEIQRIISLNWYPYWTGSEIIYINNLKKYKIYYDQFFVKPCQFKLIFGLDYLHYLTNELDKYLPLSIQPKLKLEKNSPYQFVVFDAYKEQIKNSLEENILKKIKTNKDEYLRIFNENLIKSLNNQTPAYLPNIITINNHFISLYIKDENSYNPDLILSSFLTILNTYKDIRKHNEYLKDKLNYAHTYLIKYKNETTKLITYLFNQIDLENLKCHDAYHTVLNIITSIINNNQDKDSLYLITTKLEEITKCLKETKINKDLLFENDYYPFNKVDTKNIQLEFEPNMPYYYQEYIKTKSKL